MDCNKMNAKKTVLGVLLLLAGALVMSGCESDAVAPQETLPPLTEQEAAQEAALVAVCVAKVGPRLLTFTGPKRDEELGVYPYSFPEGGDISGTIMLEYFTGGAEGTHCAWGAADYGLLYNTEDQMVTVALDLGGGIEPVFAVGFDLFGDINRATDTATVSGTGVFVSGDIIHPFSLTDVDLEAVSTYPEGGVVTFMAGHLEVVVAYDGTHWGGMFINGSLMFIVDLDTGLISPIEE